MILLAFALLALLLVMTRADDTRRARALEGLWNSVLSDSGRETLDYFLRAIEEHRFGVGLLDRAAVERDERRLRHAVAVVEGFAPGIVEGLSAMRDMSYIIGALAPLPAIRPLAWAAWRLRGLGGLALFAHVLLVTAAERVRLRIWLLGRALGLCLRSLRRGIVAQPAARWATVRTALKDLAVVGDEAEVTYRHVVRALDAVGALATA